MVTISSLVNPLIFRARFKSRTDKVTSSSSVMPHWIIAGDIGLGPLPADPELFTHVEVPVEDEDVALPPKASWVYNGCAWGACSNYLIRIALIILFKFKPRSLPLSCMWEQYKPSVAIVEKSALFLKMVVHYQPPQIVHILVSLNSVESAADGIQKEA